MYTMSANLVPYETSGTSLPSLVAKAFGTAFAAGPQGLLSRFVGGSYGKNLH